MKRLKIGCSVLLVMFLIVLTLLWFNAWTIQDRMLSSAAASLELLVTPVNGSVYLLEGIRRDGRRRMATSIASVGEDGVLLVDPFYRGGESQVLGKLKQLGSDKIRYVINTHAHPDHVGGNGQLPDDTVVLAHENTARLLNQPLKWFWWLPSFPPHPERAPDKVFTDEHRLTFNDEEIHIPHYPAAHTAGDAVVYFTQANLLACGDLFNGPGRFSLPSSVYGGTPDGLVAALTGILEWLPEDARIIGRHGPTGEFSSKADMASYLRLLSESIEMIRDKIERGQGRSEIVQEGLPQEWKDWPGEGADSSDFLTELHKLLS